MKTRREFLVMTGGAAAAGAAVPSFAWSGQTKGYSAGVPDMLDHMLLGCSDLAKGIAFVEEKAGVKAAFGGVHPGRGTQNALLSLGERHYLEIIAPDPQQSGDEHANRLQKMTEPRLIGWAAHPGELQDFAARLGKAGVVTQGPTPGSRKRPDGRILNWATLALKDDGDGLLPFFIQWSADSVHPSVDAPKGCSIKKFWAESPEPDKLAKQVGLIGVNLDVTQGAEARLRVRIKGMKGEFEL